MAAAATSLLLVLLLLLLLLAAEGGKYRCSDSGPCLNCPKSAMDEEDCVATGRRMRVTCTSTGADTRVDYRSCSMTVEDEQNRVIVFQLLMGLCGGLTYWLVQARKAKTATLFDQRSSRARAIHQQQYGDTY